jgi:hypothetical protein
MVPPIPTASSREAGSGAGVGAGVGKDLSESSTNTGDQSVRWQASWRPAPPKSDIQG